MPTPLRFPCTCRSAPTNIAFLQEVGITLARTHSSGVSELGAGKRKILEGSLTSSTSYTGSVSIYTGSVSISLLTIQRIYVCRWYALHQAAGLRFDEYVDSDVHAMGAVLISSFWYLYPPNPISCLVS